LSITPTKIRAAIAPAITAPPTPNGLRYERLAFGNFWRSITNDTICSMYAGTAPQSAMVNGLTHLEPFAPLTVISGRPPRAASSSSG